jgi:hypothetical protein
MSIFQTQTVACPACARPVEFEVNFSLAADRRPDLREEILAGTFQKGYCPACGVSFRLDPQMTYMDVGRGQYILVRPAADLADWENFERQARGTFERAFGDASGAASRAIGRRLTVRVTFGWAALREKILAAERGLDDVTLELVKLALMRGRPELPLADDVELRLMDARDDVLDMAWLRAANEELVSTLEVPRALYDEVGAGAEWAELRAAVSAGPYVDVNRLLVPAAPAAAG